MRSMQRFRAAWGPFTLVAAALWLLGCSKPWSKPGATPQTFDADSAFCAAQAGQAVGAEPSRRLWQRVYESCLRGKGYREE